MSKLGKGRGSLEPATPSPNPGTPIRKQFDTKPVRIGRDSKAGRFAVNPSRKDGKISIERKTK